MTEAISVAGRCEEREGKRESERREGKRGERGRTWEKEGEDRGRHRKRETPLATEKFPSRERGALEREEREGNEMVRTQERDKTAEDREREREKKRRSREREERKRGREEEEREGGFSSRFSSRQNFCRERENEGKKGRRGRGEMRRGERSSRDGKFPSREWNLARAREREKGSPSSLYIYILYFFLLHF